MSADLGLTRGSSTRPHPDQPLSSVFQERPVTSHHSPHTQFSMECSISDRGDARDSGLALSWPTVWGCVTRWHSCLGPGLPVRSASDLSPEAGWFGWAILCSFRCNIFWTEHQLATGPDPSGRQSPWREERSSVRVTCGLGPGFQDSLGLSWCSARQLLGKAARC